MNNVQLYILTEAGTDLEKGVANLIMSNSVGMSDKQTIEFMKSLVTKNRTLVGLANEGEALTFFTKYYKDIESIRKNNLEWMNVGKNDLVTYLVLNTFEYVVGNMLNDIELEEIGA